MPPPILWIMTCLANYSIPLHWSHAQLTEISEHFFRLMDITIHLFFPMNEYLHYRPYTNIFLNTLNRRRNTGVPHTAPDLQRLNRFRHIMHPNNL